MPYRIDLHAAPPDALDRLVRLGALDVEETAGGLAALMPDGVSPPQVAAALDAASIGVSPAVSRDDGSVWILSPRPVHLGRLTLLPAGWPHADEGLRLRDGPAFGSGLHPTTALCVEALDSSLIAWPVPRVLDVGTGSAVLALAALRLGAASAVGLDLDADALRVAADNARLNGLASRLSLVRGGPEAVSGAWPLVLANVLAAPLIEMAPLLVRRVAHEGRLILSGIASSTAVDVERAYRRLGMRSVATGTRAGWIALTLASSW